MKFEGKNNVNTITWNTIVCGVVFINLLFFSHCMHHSCKVVVSSCDESFYLPFLFLLPRLFITIHSIISLSRRLHYFTRGDNRMIVLILS